MEGLKELMKDLGVSTFEELKIYIEAPELFYSFISNHLYKLSSYIFLLLESNKSHNDFYYLILFLLFFIFQYNYNIYKV